MQELNKFEKTLKGIMDRSKCPVCRSPIKRRPGKQRIFQSKPHIEWQCTNAKCEESGHWNVGGEHGFRKY